MTPPSTHIGYARVSTDDQHLDLQLHALKAAGCTRLFTDKASGTNTSRRGLSRALRCCQAGDVLVVWKLDRLGRSLRDLVNLIEDLRERGIGLRVLTGQGAMIDTTRADGRMIVGIFAVLAEFERELIRERTKAGMAAAKARGIHVGRPFKLSARQVARARTLLEAGRQSHEAIAARYGVHVATLKRALRSGKS
ncbi:recombinase family protein [Stappia sp. WLB 29]|uniref:recombinase family protein n=1 Tax=Stappia sp. WLB 29 TaxID=2925220 RepID=UPI0020BE3BB7|nr:recombinase family protein [Stappia sp. WLB 29]